MSGRAIENREAAHASGARGTDEQNRSVDCRNADCAGESAPVDTFAMLANEDRLAILTAVVRADGCGEAPLSFSTLRSRVDVRDSGRFSYHLQELTGHLITRSADGYSLHEDCCDRFVGVVRSLDV